VTRLANGRMTAHLPCGGHPGDLLHHDDGTARGTAPTANGRTLDRFDVAVRRHRTEHPECYTERTTR
jgi:hypothetical protein